MITRDDRDPTDLGLLSDADVVELRARRRVGPRHGGRQAPSGESAPSRSIGPAEPPTARPSARVREHMAALYTQQGWTPEEVSEDERRNRATPCTRPACLAKPGEPCTELVAGVRRRHRATVHPERRAEPKVLLSDYQSG